jgi:hypothetical protein
MKPSNIPPASYDDPLEWWEGPLAVVAIALFLLLTIVVCVPVGIFRRK